MKTLLQVAGLPLLAAMIVFVCAAGMPFNRVVTVTMADLERKVFAQNDTLLVVNFWATWCKPCVEELPYFISSAEKNRDKPVQFLFVSLNAARELPTVQKFADAHNIHQPVLLLNEKSPHVWIDRVDSNWTGSIPATGFYRNGQKLLFHEGEIDANQLDSLILTYIR